MPNPTMRKEVRVKVKLYTSPSSAYESGRSPLVELTIPEFAKDPEIIVWGDMVFRRFEPESYEKIYAWFVPAPDKPHTPEAA